MQYNNKWGNFEITRNVNKNVLFYKSELLIIYAVLEHRNGCNENPRDKKPPF